MSSESTKNKFEALLKTDEAQEEYAETVSEIPNTSFDPISQFNTRGLSKDYDPVALLTEYFTNSFDEYSGEGTVNMRFDGYAPQGRGQFSHTHIMISDSAGGMTEKELRKYFLQFGGTDKDGDNESTGELGVGSLSPLSYTDGIGMVVATSIPNIDEDRWMATVVRSDENGEIECLTKDNGGFPKFDSPLDTGDSIGSKSTGTVIKLFEYNFDNIPSQEYMVKRRFGKEMPRPETPIQVFDTRFSGETDEYKIEGCLNIIEQNRTQFECFSQEPQTFSFGGGTLTLALAPEDGLDKGLKDLLYTGSKRQIFVTLDGQTHAHKPHNNLGFNDLNERVFAVFELEDIIGNLRNIFRSNRDGFMSKSDYDEVLDAINSSSLLNEKDPDEEEGDNAEGVEKSGSITSSPKSKAEVEVFGTNVKTCCIGSTREIDIYVENVSGNCRPSDIQSITSEDELQGYVEVQYYENKIGLEVTAPDEVNSTDMTDTIDLTICDTDVSVTVTYTYDTEFKFDVQETFIKHTEAITEGVSTISTYALQNLRNSSNKLEEMKKIENNFNIDNLTTQETLTERGKEIVEFVCTDYTPLITKTYGNKKYQHFTNMAMELDWLCAVCELPGSQVAKLSENLRKLGFEELTGMGSDSEYCQSMNCDNCGEDNTHRCLAAPFPTQETRLRQNMPASFVRRAKQVLSDYQDIEDTGDYEIDHKRPHMRRESDEVIKFDSISDLDIIERFQLLKGNKNKEKREKCKSCMETGERPGYDLGNGIEVEAFTEGCKQYDEELGCKGCPYYDVKEWGEELEFN